MIKRVGYGQEGNQFHYQDTELTTYATSTTELLVLIVVKSLLRKLSKVGPGFKPIRVLKK